MKIRKMQMIKSALMLTAFVSMLGLSSFSWSVPASVCSSQVVGCHDEPGTCDLLFGYNFNWVWKGVWKCTGSSYVQGSYACYDYYDTPNCCANLDERSCPVWVCPC